MKVADLSIEELKTLIAEVLEEKLSEIMGDPDWGLELKEDVKERLRQSQSALAKGRKGIPAQEVGKKLGLFSG
ncbi:MAG: hypothetical protein HYU86_00745 [Chloroflexi bacterium]|nr:hypothetical protein [Chloroflexota bacterium]